MWFKSTAPNRLILNIKNKEIKMEDDKTICQ